MRNEWTRRHKIDKLVIFVTFVTLVTLVTFVTFVTFVTLVTLVIHVTLVAINKTLTKRLDGHTMTTPSETATGADIS
jgi:hypothetical protein